MDDKILNDQNSEKPKDTEKSLGKGLGKDIRSALEQSLAAWDQLSIECTGPSADEQRLTEVKTLLKDLKKKLEELSL